MAREASGLVYDPKRQSGHLDFRQIDVGARSDPSAVESGFGHGDPQHHLSSIDFWNRSVGWACGYGGVFKSDDGGLSWTRMKPRGGWVQVR